MGWGEVSVRSMRLAAIFLVATCLGLGAPFASAASVVLTSDTTIGAGNTQFEGDDITVDGVVLTIEGAHDFASLSLVNGATLTHPPSAAAPPNIAVSGDALIDGTASVQLSGRGRSDLSGSQFNGGSHGGWASPYSTGRIAPYGSLTQPIEYGIGRVRRGGGAIRLSVAGTLQLDGSIAADGQTGTQSYGGGSGGSIWIDAGTLQGSGVIHADGGTSATRGAGGGGRVAVYFTSNAGFDLMRIQANGASGSGGNVSGAGTVYLSGVGADAEVRVVSGAVATERTPVVPFAGELYVEGARVEVDGSGYGSAVVSTSGLLDVSTAAAFTGAVRAEADGKLRVDGTLSGGSLELVGGGAVTQLTAASAGSTGTATLEFDAVSIDAASRIDVSFQGRSDLPGSQFNGGSHGGWATVLASGRIAPYGSLTQPVDYGIGRVRRGGGAIRLSVAGTLQLDGSIAADGQTGTTSYGGGSGGSIWIDAGTLQGSGVIHADGGASATRGAGGGGRVAVYYTSNAGFDVTRIQANGASGSAGNVSGAGTVYLSGAGADAEVRVVSGMVATEPTPVVPFAGELYVEGARVEVDGSGYGSAVVSTSGLLDVSSTATFAGAVRAEVDGKLRVDGTLSGGSLALVGGGAVTQLTAASAGSTGTATLEFDAVSVDAASRLDVSFQGRSDLPGSQFNGGSHGGWATVLASGRIAPYGSLTQPVDYGIGRVRRGGGAIRLSVAGTLQLDGSIAADGQTGTTSYGGGSGGSIWIDAGTLQGSGVIHADGGASATRGAGGGGRVAVYYTSNAGFDVTRIQANGASGGAGNVSGAGTVYLSGAGADAEVRVVSGMVATEPTPVVPFAGELYVEGARVEVDGSEYGSAVVSTSGLLDVSNAATFAGAVRAEVDGKLRVDGTLSGGSLALVGGGAVTQLTAASAGSTGTATLEFDAVSVDAASRLDVSFQGRSDLPGSQFNGGSHGGWATVLASGRIAPYGSLTQPVDYGIGRVRRGGGAIRLSVAGTLQLDGSIAADGQTGTTSYGGGSGGSIWIDAGTLQGSGVIHADGGASATRGAGGGGRVAMYYTSNAGFDVTRIHANGASGSAGNVSGAGTVYLAADGSTPKIRIASSPVATERTPIDGGSEDLFVEGAIALAGGVFGDIVVGTSGRLRPDGELAGASLTVEEGGSVEQIASFDDSTDVSARLSFGDVFVDPGGAIDVSRQGRIGAAGDVRNGGSHGGFGGRFTGALSQVYGSIDEPNQPGAGVQRRGGGVLALEVSGLLRVDGAIRADGQNGTSSLGNL